MKAFILSLLTLMVFSAPSAVVAQKPVKAVISVPNAQDEACKDRIEKFLAREYGVLSSNVNYRRHTVTVSWVPGRTNIENIKTALANLGYDADDVKAEPEAYKRLPKTCQHLTNKEETKKEKG
ncbi:MAG TPA: heavy-metal-associated domain-containing protein [Ginsengibacter sp.]|nr:heavy-metal-associated domain-containing protein [Ginsengibacter sp.]HRP44099.1 heavy-metal-associated domain-containing protein [Ginsengibacter sp.]